MSCTSSPQRVRKRVCQTVARTDLAKMHRGLAVFLHDSQLRGQLRISRTRLFSALARLDLSSDDPPAMQRLSGVHFRLLFSFFFPFIVFFSPPSPPPAESRGATFTGERKSSRSVLQSARDTRGARGVWGRGGEGRARETRDEIPRDELIARQSESSKAPGLSVPIQSPGIAPFLSPLPLLPPSKSLSPPRNGIAALRAACD
jgi:hypothetical protein